MKSTVGKAKEYITDKLWDLEYLIKRPYYYVVDYLMSERVFLDRYIKYKDFDDLLKFIARSKDIDIDIEEIVHWNRVYEYKVCEEFYHSHSLKSLLIDLLFVLRNNPDADIKLIEEGFHKDELKMVNNYIKLLRNDLCDKGKG